MQEDVTQLAGLGEGAVESQQPQEPVAPQPEPQPDPEPYRMKYRGEERELPYAPVNGLAEALGTTPEGVINFLQRSREADRIQRENIAYRQRIEELENQTRGATYQERLSPIPAPAPQPYQAPQYQQPYQYQQPAVDDPIALLNEMRRELGMTRQEFAQFKEAARAQQEAFEAQQREARQYQYAQELNAQAERFLHEVNAGRKEPIELSDFLQEVQLSGGGQPHVPFEHAMQRAITWMTRDERLHQAQTETLDKLRQARAVVTVPGARAGAAPPPPPNPAQGMTLGQIIENLPMK